MTVRLTVELDAASEQKLRRKLARMRGKAATVPHVMSDAVDQFFYDFGHDVLKHAADRAPVDTGKMKRSLRFRWGPGGAEVSARKPAAYADYGTRPHWPPVQALAGWAKRHGIPVYALARKIAREGTPKTDWFTGAVDLARRDLPRRLRSAVRRVETEWGR